MDYQALLLLTGAVAAVVIFIVAVDKNALKAASARNIDSTATISQPASSNPSSPEALEVQTESAILVQVPSVNKEPSISTSNEQLAAEVPQATEAVSIGSIATAPIPEVPTESAIPVQETPIDTQEIVSLSPVEETRTEEIVSPVSAQESQAEIQDIVAISSIQETPILAQDPVTPSPVQEAPAPFPEEEEHASSPAPTGMPTDVTAVDNVISPVDIVSPVLVIPTPKRRSPRRTSKRLPHLATPGSVPARRRRASKKAAQPAPSPEPIVPETSFTSTVISSPSEQSDTSSQQSE